VLSCGIEAHPSDDKSGSKVDPDYIHQVIIQKQMVADIARVIIGKTSVVDPSFYFTEE
jgi:hypothetical protein